MISLRGALGGSRLKIFPMFTLTWESQSLPKRLRPAPFTTWCGKIMWNSFVLYQYTNLTNNRNTLT